MAAEETKVKKVIALGLAILVVLSVAACEGRTTTKSGTSELPDELPSERVWISTRDGLNVVSSDGWHSFYQDTTVFDIALEARDKLWVVTRENLAYFDGRKFVVSSESHKADEIDIDARGRLWLAGIWASPGYGVGLYDDGEWTAFAFSKYGIEGIGAGSFRDIQLDDDGNVWVATFEGLVMYDQREWKMLTLPISNQVAYCLAIDDMGRLWVGHRDGVSIFDGASWTTWTSSDMALTGIVTVESIAFDGRGSAWLGIPHKGVLTFDGENWERYNTSNSGLVSNLIQAIACDDQGRVWIGTACGISVFDGAEWTTYNMSNSGLVSDDVTKILIEKSSLASLPPLQKIKVGELTGVIKRDDKAIVGARVMLCTSVTGTIPGIGFGGETPCEGPVQMETFTSEYGDFRFENVPIGKYVLAVQDTEGKWFTIMAKTGVPVAEKFIVEEGKITSIGVLNLGE